MFEISKPPVGAVFVNVPFLPIFGSLVLSFIFTHLNMQLSKATPQNLNDPEEDL